MPGPRPGSKQAQIRAWFHAHFETMLELALTPECARSLTIEQRMPACRLQKYQNRGQVLVAMPELCSYI